MSVDQEGRLEEDGVLMVLALDVWLTAKYSGVPGLEGPFTSPFMIDMLRHVEEKKDIFLPGNLYLPDCV